MTDEDRTAARLKGFNVVIKFVDGEELFVDIPFLDTDDEKEEWITQIERFLNVTNSPTGTDIPGIAINRQIVKYIRII